MFRYGKPVDSSAHVQWSALGPLRCRLSSTRVDKGNARQKTRSSRIQFLIISSSKEDLLLLRGHRVVAEAMLFLRLSCLEASSRACIMW